VEYQGSEAGAVEVEGINFDFIGAVKLLGYNAQELVTVANP
jgi:hypothetical protein